MGKWMRRIGKGCAATTCGLVAFDCVYDQVLSRGILAIASATRIGYMYRTTDPQTMEELSALHARAADLLVWTLLRNEGLFIKFGQGMSSLNHVLPPEYTTRLQVLLDHAPRAPLADVYRTIEEDLGRPASQVFVRFDEEPVAAASIAQVHRAAIRLPDGTLQEVAVKVLKPKIRNQIWWDLTTHDIICYGLQWAFNLKLVWACKTIRENLTREVDFRNEYNFTEQGRQVWAHRSDLIIPRLYERLCTRRVLVSEWIDATKLLNVEEVKTKYDVTAAMKTLMEAYGEGLFRHGFVHADPHPANVLIRMNPASPPDRPQQQVVLLDFGLCVNTSDEFRRDYARMWRAIFTQDMPELESIVRNWGVGNAELFASFTLQKPFSREAPVHQSNVSKTEIRQFQQRTKASINQLLEDDAKIPRELVFVGRGAQLLRSINKSYGAPVNRANIFASKAVEALGGHKRFSWSVVRYELTLLSLSMAHYWTLYCNALLGMFFATYRVSTLEDVMEATEQSFAMKHSHRMDISARD